MRVTAFATLGRRGQMTISDKSLYTLPEVREEFMELTSSKKTVVIAGLRTYHQILPHIQEHMDGYRRMMIGWTPREGTPDRLMEDLFNTRNDNVLIVGGAYTFAQFYRHINHLALNYTNYDNHYSLDDKQLWFPYRLYGMYPPTPLPVRVH